MPALQTINADLNVTGYLDLNKKELRNPRMQNLSTAPASPVLGQFYLDTDDNTPYYWNGSSWVAMTGTAYTDEMARDAIGTALVAGNNIDITVNDPGDTITIDVEALTSADLSDFTEAAQDAVGAMVTGNTETGIAVTYVDGSNILNFVVDVLNNLPAPTGSLSMNNQKITNLLDPTAAQDAATKAYVDVNAAGFDPKGSVRVATTAAGTLASSFENGDVIDGVTLATGNRILIKDQAAGAENGIYTVNASGAPTRATDADASAEVTGGMYVWVNEGTVNGDSAWALTTNDPITLGSTALVFTQVSGLGQVVAGNALTKTGNTLDVAPGTGLEISADTIRIAAAAAGAGLIGGAGSALAVGAGTGIVVNADDVAVDRATVLGRVALVSNGTLTGGGASEVITHHACSKRCAVVITNNASPFDEQVFPTERTSSTTTTVYTAAGTTLPAGFEWTVIG